jgi:MoxR-like ATPase
VPGRGRQGRRRREDPLLCRRARFSHPHRTSETRSGASTRAEVLLTLAARASAAFEGQQFVTPDHVKALLAPAFRHRLILRPEAEVGGQTPDSVLEAVASRVVPPR